MTVAGTRLGCSECEGTESRSFPRAFVSSSSSSSGLDDDVGAGLGDTVGALSSKRAIAAASPTFTARSRSGRSKICELSRVLI